MPNTLHLSLSLNNCFSVQESSKMSQFLHVKARFCCDKHWPFVWWQTALVPWLLAVLADCADISWTGEQLGSQQDFGGHHLQKLIQFNFPGAVLLVKTAAEGFFADAALMRHNFFHNRIISIESINTNQSPSCTIFRILSIRHSKLGPVLYKFNICCFTNSTARQNTKYSYKNWSTYCITTTPRRIWFVDFVDGLPRKKSTPCPRPSSLRPIPRKR